jgi:hypothetical protein
VINNQDESGATGASGGEQSGEIRISRHDHPVLFTCGLENCGVGSLAQAKLTGVYHVVSPPSQPQRQLRRQGHVDEESHRINSTVSSSAR